MGVHAHGSPSRLSMCRWGITTLAPRIWATGLRSSSPFLMVRSLRLILLLPSSEDLDIPLRSEASAFVSRAPGKGKFAEVACVIHKVVPASWSSSEYRLSCQTVSVPQRACKYLGSRTVWPNPTEIQRLGNSSCTVGGSTNLRCSGGSSLFFHAQFDQGRNIVPACLSRLRNGLDFAPAAETHECHLRQKVPLLEPVTLCTGDADLYRKFAQLA